MLLNLGENLFYSAPTLPICQVGSFMQAVREIFLKGSTLVELWYEAVVMFITGVTVFGSSLLFFHRREQ